MQFDCRTLLIIFESSCDQGRFATDGVFRSAILDRVLRMAARDKNHAVSELCDLRTNSELLSTPKIN